MIHRAKSHPKNFSERVSHLLMLEAYLDDSGDEDLHAVSVGGAIGTKEAWSQFEEDWAFVRHAFSVVELHMTDMHTSRKAFSCWRRDDPRKGELLKCLLHLMQMHDLVPIAQSVPMHGWRSMRPSVREGLLGKAYYASLQRAMGLAAQEAFIRGERVFVFVARKDKYIGDAANLFSGLQAVYEFGRALEDVSLTKTPRELPALQVGDFVAWEMNRSYIDNPSIGRTTRPTFAELLRMVTEYPGYINWLPPSELPDEVP